MKFMIWLLMLSVAQNMDNLLQFIYQFHDIMFWWVFVQTEI